MDKRVLLGWILFVLGSCTDNSSVSLSDAGTRSDERGEENGSDEAASTEGSEGTGAANMSGAEGSGQPEPSDVDDCALRCNDGFSCTNDSCRDGDCVYTFAPLDDPGACPSGEYCTLEQGCVAAPPCAEDLDCEEAWADDACKQSPRCDAASSVCVFSILDKDGDGHAPLICGGGDCNDDDFALSPREEDVCDTVDNNCDGEVDEGIDFERDSTNCGECGRICPGATIRIGTCVAGQCECPQQSSCDGDCVDISTNPSHCGACSDRCPSGSDCEEGKCACAEGTELCGEGCVDTESDDRNCGECGLECPEVQYCDQGTCNCPEMIEACIGCESVLATKCGEQCIDIALDLNNCGGCGVPCEAGTDQQSSCVDGRCLVECVAGFADCDGDNANGCEQETDADDANCGVCGRSCQGAACSTGHCAPEVLATDVVGSLFDLTQDETTLYWTSTPSSGLGLNIISMSKLGGAPLAAVELAEFQNIPSVARFQLDVDPEKICWAQASLATPGIISSQVSTELWCHRKDDDAEFLVSRIQQVVIDLKSDGEHLYYAGNSDEPAVMRVLSQEGENPEPVSSAGSPMELGLDGEFVYWLAQVSDQFQGTVDEIIYRAPKAGGTSTEVGRVNFFIAMAIGRDAIYVSDGGGPNNLLAIDKDTLQRSIIVTEMQVLDVATDDDTVFWTASDNGIEEGGASKLVGNVSLDLSRGHFQRLLVDDTHVYLMNSYGSTNSIVRIAK